MKKRLYKCGLTIFAIVILSITLSIAVMAKKYSGSCGDNVSYTFDTAVGELIISGTGEMTNYSQISEIPWFNNRLFVKKIIINHGVQSIGNYMFSFCSNLEKVSISESVKIIENHAFYYCSNLNKIDIPNSVVSIGKAVFSNCINLASISFNQSVISIGDYSFKNCRSLESITIPNSVINIGKWIFSDCSKLISVIIGDNVIEIGEYAFIGCSNLRTITIPNSVTFIDTYAFSGCTNLNTIYLYENSYSDTFFSSDSYTKIYLDASKEGFSAKSDGWSFVNSYEGFGYGSNFRNIPLERFSEVFGEKYVNLAMSGSHIFSSMIPKWGGSCFGMSVTSILFYLNYLDWSSFIKNEDAFSNVNSYYESVNISNGDYFVSSKSTSELTKLIERYQILLYGSDDSYRLKEGSTFESSRKNGNFDYLVTIPYITPQYKHNPDGNYISELLDLISKSEVPLIVEMQYGTGAHAMVIRTDIAPQYDSDGWYRIYVYDPNHPYVSDKSLHGKNLRYYYLNLDSDDTYIELNPLENKWRYASISSNGDKITYRGCDEYGEVLFGNFTTQVRPHYLFVYNLVDINLPLEFNGTENWENKHKDQIALSIIGYTNFKLKSPSGEDLVEVKDGVPYIYNDTIEYISYVGDFQNCGGKLIVPYTDVIIEYFGGDDISIFGFENVVNIACDGAAIFDVSMENNKVNIKSDDDNRIVAQISDTSDKGYTSIYIDGQLTKSDNVSLSLKNDVVSISENLNENSNMDIYTENDSYFTEFYLTTINADSNDLEFADIRNIIVPLGDVSGDGKIDSKDMVLLAQFIANWDIEIDESATDCNGDGTVDTNDMVLLAQFIANWEVSLG